MTELEEVPPRRAADGGSVSTDVAEMIARAGRLTPAQAHALAGAVAWRWQPLVPPGRGSLTAARSEALAAARVAGRADMAAAAMSEARLAALGSAGGRSTDGRTRWAESGLAAVLIGVVGAVVCASNGLTAPAIALGILALIGAGVLFVSDSAAMARRRIAMGVEGEALALVVRDLVPPETVETLAGPWSAVMRD